MSRSALSSIGKAIAASTEEKTLDELTARGRNKFRVVSGKKVTQIIQAIVDDVIEQEAGDIAKRDRDSLVKQTQRKFERVMRLQAEQDSRLAQLQEQLIMYVNIDMYMKGRLRCVPRTRSRGCRASTAARMSSVGSPVWTSTVKGTAQPESVPQ